MEKRVIIVTEKKHIAVICDPALTVKDIMDRMSMTPPEIVMVGFRDMGGPDNMRQWRFPNGEKMGHKGHGWNHAVMKEVGTSAMANLLYNTLDLWKFKAGGGKQLKVPMQEKVKNGTVKSLDDMMHKPKTRATVTVTFTGSVADVEAAIQEYAKGRK
jgi:hypothetical protein